MSVLKFKDVFLLPSPCGGAVLNKDLEVLDAPFNFQSYTQSPKGSHDLEILKGRVSQGDVLSLPEDEYCFGLPWYNCYVYGHIWDSIQHLPYYKEAGLENLPLLVRKETAHVPHFFKNHIGIFGFNNLSVLEVDKIYHAKSVYISPHSTHPARFDARSLTSLQEVYFQHFPPNPEKYNKNLFLTRCGQRLVSNEAEVWGLLRDKNFTILDGYKYNESLHAHISLFHQPNLVIGAHGALFQNLIFTAKEGSASYYEFCPSTRKEDCFVQNAEAVGLANYNQIFLDPINDSYDLALPLNQIKDILKKHGI